MSDKPTITAELLAHFIDQAPSRLVRKLDKKPELAATYEWSADGEVWSVDTGKETVRLASASLSEVSQIGCTCLLAPKCLHILAVISSLETTAEAGQTARDAEPETLDEQVEMNSEKRAAAAAMKEAATRIVNQGAAYTRMTEISSLLRAVHHCRIHGLHRLASAGLRLAESCRHLREGSPDFDLQRCTLELFEIFKITRVIDDASTEVDRSWVGTARRAYRDIGNRNLAGLFAEPVVTKTGYAGVVAYLADKSNSSVWTLSDVRPGDPTRAPGAYEGGIDIGDLSMAPRDLVRAGVFVQNGTGSDDGRLGAGAQVKAARSKPTTWSDALGDAPWQVPFAEQLDRVFAAIEAPPLTRRPDADLVFLDLTILGADRDALIVEHDGRPLRCVPPTTSDAVHYVRNYRLLARAPQVAIRTIARITPERASSIALLAASPREGFELPEDWQGRCNLGLDRLEPEFFEKVEPAPVDLEWTSQAFDDPLAPLRRRLERLAQGGRATLSAHGLDRLQREGQRLQRKLMPTAARLLTRLGESAQPDSRTFTGESFVSDPDKLAEAFTDAMIYERAARRVIQQQLF